MGFGIDIPEAKKSYPPRMTWGGIHNGTHDLKTEENAHLYFTTLSPQHFACTSFFRARITSSSVFRVWYNNGTRYKRNGTTHHTTSAMVHATQHDMIHDEIHDKTHDTPHTLHRTPYIVHHTRHIAHHT